MSYKDFIISSAAIATKICIMFIVGAAAVLLLRPVDKVLTMLKSELPKR